MKKNRVSYIQNIVLPCLLFSGITGIFTGTLIFLFKAAAAWVSEKSEMFYTAARTDSVWIPVLLLGTAGIGLLSAVLLHYVPDARGGGIPTAITILRGHIPFHWLKSIVFVFISALLTYFCGIPLGNEGPSVQMGTAAGKGTVSLFARKHPAWNRYIMTGGACAGFAAATGSPITGMLFAIEEAHHRISPMIFMASAMSTITGVSTAQLLCRLTDTSFTLFHFRLDAVLPLEYIWTAVLVGLVTGLAAAGFTKMYQGVRYFVRTTLKRIPNAVKIVTIFVLSACTGVFSASCIGSGHHLIDALFEGRYVTITLLGILIVRALLLLFANTADITGGLFVPTLTFGAILGALSGKILIMAGVLPEEYFLVIVVIGIAAYLGASSRTPLIALVFAAEALNGSTNLVPIAAAVTISFLVIEALGIPAFTDTVIESKTETVHHGQKAYIIEADLTVLPDSFACGKEVRDLLLPPTCVILSIQREKKKHIPNTMIAAGDVLHLYFKTFDPSATIEYLEGFFGDQRNTEDFKIISGKENEIVPD